MTKIEATAIRVLLQCYRKHRDDRLLDVIELLAFGKDLQQLKAPRNEEEDYDKTDSTDYALSDETAVDSSAAVRYCCELDDENGKETDGM